MSLRCEDFVHVLLPLAQLTTNQRKRNLILRALPAFET